MIPLTNRCIEFFLGNNYEKLWGSFVQLSFHQLEYMKEMIPETLYIIWKENLLKKKFALKLCGAGGGGFF